MHGQRLKRVILISLQYWLVFWWFYSHSVSSLLLLFLVQDERIHCRTFHCWHYFFFLLLQCARRLAIYYLWKKRSQKRTHVLLTGLCEAGKTATFSQLLFNELRETFTSISENSGYYSIDGTSKIVQVVDIPGHERLRNRFVDQYKRIAKGIVYVVDSANIQKEIRDVAE